MSFAAALSRPPPAARRSPEGTPSWACFCSGTSSYTFLLPSAIVVNRGRIMAGRQRRGLLDGATRGRDAQCRSAAMTSAFNSPTAPLPPTALPAPSPLSLSLLVSTSTSASSSAPAPSPASSVSFTSSPAISFASSPATSFASGPHDFDCHPCACDPNDSGDQLDEAEAKAKALSRWTHTGKTRYVWLFFLASWARSCARLCSGHWAWDHHLARKPPSLRHVVRHIPAVLAAAVLSLAVLVPVLIPSYTRLPPHYRELEARCFSARGEERAGCANQFNEKIFIAVSLFDAGGHLADGAWGRRLLELIDLLGPDNVFVSIYENDSGPRGAASLERLKARFRCRHSVVIDSHVPLHDFPTVRLPDGSSRVKRMSYLAEMRNRALRPLDKQDPDHPVTFDKVLFMNDITFRPIDAAHLLFNTNADVGPHGDGRSRYLSACGLDYDSPFHFYDNFAQRDADGFATGFAYFPIFSGAGRGASRATMLAQSDAVPVSTCWNGIVAMRARHVQNLNTSLPRVDFRDLGAHVIDPSQPRPAVAPVRFRHEPEAFVEGCECCLFLADLTQVARKNGDPDLGVYVNPYVRVAYFDIILWSVHVAKRWERLLTLPQAYLTRRAGLPMPNPYRTVQEGESFMEEVWVQQEGEQQGHWEMVPRKARNGMFCTQRMMQVMLSGTRKRTAEDNWINVDIPAGYTLHLPSERQ